MGKKNKRAELAPLNINEPVAEPISLIKKETPVCACCIHRKMSKIVGLLCSQHTPAQPTSAEDSCEHYKKDNK